MCSFHLAALSFSFHAFLIVGLIWSNSRLSPSYSGGKTRRGGRPRLYPRSLCNNAHHDKPICDREGVDLYAAHSSDVRVIELKSEEEFVPTLACLRSQSSAIPSFFDFDDDTADDINVDVVNDDSVYTPFVATLCPSTAWLPTPGFHFILGDDLPNPISTKDQEFEHSDRLFFELEDLSSEDDVGNILATDSDPSHATETNNDRINQVLFQRAHSNFVEFMSRIDLPSADSHGARQSFSSQSSLSMQWMLVDISGILSARASGHISRVERKDSLLEVSMTLLKKDDVATYLRATGNGQTHHHHPHPLHRNEKLASGSLEDVEITKIWTLPITGEATPGHHTVDHASEDQILRLIDDWSRKSFAEKILFSIHLGMVVNSPESTLRELAAHTSSEMSSVAEAALAVISYRQSLLVPADLSHFQFRDFQI